MSDIKIDGLNPSQVRMLDKMWSIGDTDEFESWFESLTGDDRRQAELLREMILLECEDQILDTQAEFPIVEKMLKDIDNRH